MGVERVGFGQRFVRHFVFGREGKRCAATGPCKFVWQEEGYLDGRRTGIERG